MTVRASKYVPLGWEILDARTGKPVRWGAHEDDTRLKRCVFATREDARAVARDNRCDGPYRIVRAPMLTVSS